jgi:hypothetical protein
MWWSFVCQIADAHIHHPLFLGTDSAMMAFPGQIDEEILKVSLTILLVRQAIFSPTLRSSLFLTDNVSHTFLPLCGCIKK